MEPNDLRDHLKEATPFGCLYMIILGLPSFGLVLLGGVMGDCAPDAACDRGANILLGWAVVAAVLIPLGGLIWLLIAKMRQALRYRYRAGTVTVLLFLFTMLAAWLSWEAAMSIRL